MFWNKKTEPSPLGVALGDLLLMLRPTSIKASIEGNALIARHEHYTTRVEVVPPEQSESENGLIRAVVRITTELPSPLQSFFDSPDVTVVMNKFTALGALTVEHGKVFVGSRLTIYDAEDAWRTLHLPMLLYTIIGGAEAIFGAMRRALSDEISREGESLWTEDDMEQVASYLSQTCLCSTGATAFTAEFALTNKSGTAMLGDQRTAMLQFLTDQPHPELGGGLFCLLQMPHQIESDARLKKICAQLNRMEMAAHDLPPHFGAWCEGKLGGNPAYVSFLPNALRTASGIAVNMAVWASHRAEWANAMLASLGVRSAARKSPENRQNNDADPDTQYRKGIMFESADGVEQDYKLAAFWLGKAALQGHADAQVNLGVLYNYGRGVTQDYKRAMRLWEQAAAQGNAIAQYNLGDMYNECRGVTQNYVEELKWFSIAAENGDADAALCCKNVEEKMSRQQVAEARRLVREWLDAHA